MARLCCHGAVLLRVSYENTQLASDLIDWQRVTRTFHSDGASLQKRDVRFVADSFSKAHKHSYGWKKRGKIKPALLTPDGLRSLASRYQDKGWTIEIHPVTAERRAFDLA